MGKVLYIMGRGRSGSTILANVLGQLEGFFSAGEVRCLWDPLLTSESVCVCGETVAHCPIWSAVLDRLQDVDASEVAPWQRSVVRERNLYRMLRGRHPAVWDSAEAYGWVMNRVYRAIAEVTGCSVIIDSSKRPSYAAFLLSLESTQPYYVHLVRDPRASAYSWRNRHYESARADGTEVTRRSALDSTVRWSLLNVGTELVLRHVSEARRLRIRYEDFVSAPRAVVRRIAELVEESPRSLPFVDPRTAVIGANHTLAGNPSRSASGRVVVEDRGEWRRAMGLTDRWISTVAAFPFLSRYRYRFLPPPR